MFHTKGLLLKHPFKPQKGTCEGYMKYTDHHVMYPLEIGRYRTQSNLKKKVE